MQFLQAIVQEDHGAGNVLQNGAFVLPGNLGEIVIVGEEACQISRLDAFIHEGVVLRSERDVDNRCEKGMADLDHFLEFSLKHVEFAVCQVPFEALDGDEPLVCGSGWGCCCRDRGKLALSENASQHVLLQGDARRCKISLHIGHRITAVDCVAWRSKQRVCARMRLSWIHTIAFRQQIYLRVRDCQLRSRMARSRRRRLLLLHLHDMVGWWSWSWSWSCSCAGLLENTLNSWARRSSRTPKVAGAVAGGPHNTGTRNRRSEISAQSHWLWRHGRCKVAVKRLGGWRSGTDRTLRVGWNILINSVGDLRNMAVAVGRDVAVGGLLHRGGGRGWAHSALDGHRTGPGRKSRRGNLVGCDNNRTIRKARRAQRGAWWRGIAELFLDKRQHPILFFAHRRKLVAVFFGLSGRFFAMSFVFLGHFFAMRFLASTKFFVFLRRSCESFGPIEFLLGGNFHQLVVNSGTLNRQSQHHVAFLLLQPFVEVFNLRSVALV
ncbi:hypothetical protein CAOG_009378 [Capsaspora owczarzaki ATCC 30864]|uniref:Uncharacterized protein n=1 Tax=Capsaspora owczarzaki (strain ATCC 30864) TaxID=595528 RepID=A0A0D2VI74_CAPO3|nr:hypothetical protein CAOG_009378 [Capsaspora owczarzaki ATCC 30864]